MFTTKHTCLGKPESANYLIKLNSWKTTNRNTNNSWRRGVWWNNTTTWSKCL